VTGVPDIAPYLALVAEFLRPEWDQAVLGDALGAADAAGWTPQRLLREFTALACNPDGTPGDLLNSAAKPARRRPGPAEIPLGPGLAEYHEQRARLGAMPPLPEHNDTRHRGAA
jgi:hypothetical protein